MGVGAKGFSQKSQQELWRSFESSALSVAAILKAGALSSQDRYQIGKNVDGISSQDDIVSGGGDSVFTRLILTQRLETSLISNIPFSGHIQILIDLEVLDRVGYGSSSDNYGAKKEYKPKWIDPYRGRPNILKLTQAMKKIPKITYNNEICIKHRIPPEYICGLHVRTQKNKNELIQILRQQNVVMTKNDVETINGVPVQDFIHVGATFNPKAWNKKLTKEELKEN